MKSVQLADEQVMLAAHLTHLPDELRPAAKRVFLEVCRDGALRRKDPHAVLEAICSPSFLGTLQRYHT